MSDNDPHANWEARYDVSPVWSGKVNEALRLWGEGHRPEIGDNALDLACGEGGDAMWLAQEGWQVTGVDFASAAITRAARSGSKRGLAVTWITADLATWTPHALYKLVTLSFFHEPIDVRHAVWKVAAEAVAAGGTLLITAHAPDADPQAPGPPPHTRFDLREIFDLIGDGWALNYREVRRDAIGRHTGHVVTDMVVELSRLEGSDSPSL